MNQIEAITEIWFNRWVSVFQIYHIPQPCYRICKWQST